MKVQSINQPYNGKYTFPLRQNLSNNNNLFQQNKFNFISFNGLSSPSEYKTTFDYLASLILSMPNNPFGVKIEEKLCSARRIKQTLATFLEDKDIFLRYPLAILEKIKWAPHLPMHIREFAVERSNLVRKTRLEQWGRILMSPTDAPELQDYPKLIHKIETMNGSLKIVTWNAITNNLSHSNKHTPPIFNAQAFEQTIDSYTHILPKARKVQCKTNPFYKMYVHRLRDNLLEGMGLSNQDSVWVKIPSLKNDKVHQSKNIRATEILSHTNWCTSSSQYKAKDVLERGNFYIYLKRDQNEMWEPQICVVTNKSGKVDEIQSGANDDSVPVSQIHNIRTFLKEHNLKLDSGIDENGPKAYEQMAIAEKLAEINPEIKISFASAIKNKDVLNIFRYLGINIRPNYELIEETNIKDFFTKFMQSYINTGGEISLSVSKDNEQLLRQFLKEATKENLAKLTEAQVTSDPQTLNTYVISSYKPEYYDSKIKRVIPYSLMGINEDMLLHDVSSIEGDMVLYNPKRKLFPSSITVFPPKLTFVEGKIYCNQKQYDMFHTDMLKAVDGHEASIVVLK